jgi:hypothetical protein
MWHSFCIFNWLAKALWAGIIEERENTVIDLEIMLRANVFIYFT